MTRKMRTSMLRIEKSVQISHDRSISRLCDYSERIKQCHLEDLFDQLPFRFIWEIFSQASNNAQKSFVYRCQLLSIARYSFTRLHELRPSRVNELIVSERKRCIRILVLSTENPVLLWCKWLCNGNK